MYIILGGDSIAQLVKHLTLDFGWSHDLRVVRLNPESGSTLGMGSASYPLPPPKKKECIKSCFLVSFPQVLVLRITMILALNLYLLLMLGPSKQCPGWMVREAATDSKRGGAQGFRSQVRSHVQSGKLFGRRNPASHGHGKRLTRSGDQEPEGLSGWVAVGWLLPLLNAQIQLQ